MNSEERNLADQRSEALNTSIPSTPKSVSPPYSTPSPQSPHSPGFRQNPINPEITHHTSVLGLDPEVVSQRFQQSAESSISTPSSLTSSSNPLVSPPSQPNSSPPASPPTITPPARMPFFPTTINELPIPGSKLAPPKFTGKYNKAKRFTDHYAKLIQGIPDMSGAQKCQSMMQYCSTKVSNFLEQISSYRNNNFDQLVKDIHDYYDVQLAESRWKEKDLIKFIKQYKNTKIKTLSQWKAYNRRFLRIANWLKNHTLIDDNHYKAYFWDGIHKDLQAIFETRMLNKNPLPDFSKPFEVADIQKIAQQYFMRDKFAALVGDSDDSDSDSESFESTDEESSDSSSDSDSNYKKKKKNAKIHSKTKRKMDHYRRRLQEMREGMEDKEETKPKFSFEPSPKKDPKSTEIDELIDQLQKLSVDNPAYGIVYYKVTKLDKNLIDCLRKPVIQSAPTSPTYQEKKRYKPGQAVFHIVPATESNAIPITDPQVYYTKNPMFNPSGDDRCFGCGGRGHTIRGCQKITELLNAGIIKRSPDSGQLFLQDGTYIKRMQNETLAQAAERMTEERQAMTAQCAMIRPITYFYDTTGDHDSDIESDLEFEQNQEYLSNESDDEYYTDEENSDQEYGSEEDPDWEEMEPYEGWEPNQILDLINEVYELGPEKTTRQTRSTRQRITDKFSALPRGVTDKMKKTILENKEKAEKVQEVPAPVPVSLPNPTPQQVEVSPPRMTTRSQVPKVPVQLDEDIEMQDQPPRPKSVVQQPKHNNIQAPTSRTKYPSGLKPYVEIIPRPRNPPASESKRELASKNQIPKIIPTNVRTPRKVQLPDDDELATLKPVSKPPKKISRPRYVEEKENRQVLRDPQTHVMPTRRPGRKSELSSKINDSQIIDKLLEVSVPLKISEILAVSPRVANSVSDLMKPRNQASLKAPITYEVNTSSMVNMATQRSLIKILLKTDGGPLNAIVDTGSQINVVNKKHCGTIIRQPIKPTTSIGMQDASGRHSRLTGLIEEVPLNCGSVKTSANLYVGENLPFDLLLGRPWQKGNRISIDERNDGTYLVFKHPTDPHSDMELLVDNSSTENSQMTRQAMTSMVFTACEKPNIPENTIDDALGVVWHEEIAPDASDWWNRMDPSGWESDKITESLINGSEAVITDPTEEAIKRSPELPKQDMNSRVPPERERTTWDEHCTAPEILEKTH